MSEMTAANDPEGIYSMYEEVVEEIAQMKRRPPANAQDITFMLLRTVMPLIRDLSHYVRENRMDIDGLLENQDGVGSSDETQFTEEDAKKFDLVIQFAKTAVTEAIKAVAEGSEEANRLKVIETMAEQCLLILESSAIVGGEDDEDEEEGAKEAGSEQVS